MPLTSHNIYAQFCFCYRVQDTDGSFFENYTALSWKIQNRQLLACQDLSQDEQTPPEISVNIKPPPIYRIQSLEVSQRRVVDFVARSRRAQFN